MLGKKYWFLGVMVLLGAGLFFSVRAITSEIRPINTFASIDVQAISEKTLVICDIGEVLITRSDLDENKNKPLDDIFQLMIENSFIPGAEEDSENNVRFKELVQKRFALCDPKIPETIRLLQKKKINVIVLTSSVPGEVAPVVHHENWTIAMLKSFGLDFSPAYGNGPEFVFSQFNKGTQNPMFKSGIVFTSKLDKGDVLEAFFSAKECKPEAIIFIDDLKKNLDAVQAFATKRNINFLGFHYTANKV